MQGHMMLDEVKVKDNVNVMIGGRTKTVGGWINECVNADLKTAYGIFIHIMKYFPYSWWEHVMTLFAEDLKRIIAGAPPVRKKMVIYRGVNDDYYLKGSEKALYKNTCFVSCTVSPYHALRYLRNQKCCFKRLTVYPGQRMLFISGISCYPREMEFVLNMDTRMYIHKKQTLSIYPDEYTGKSNVCFRKKTDVELTDLIVLNDK
jgi:hypothetical protein